VRRQWIRRIERDLKRQMQAALAQLFGVRPSADGQRCDCLGCTKARAEEVKAAN